MSLILSPLWQAPVAALIKAMRSRATERRRARAESAAIAWLGAQCPKHPEIAGVYEVALAVEGGVLDGNICVRFKPGTPQPDRDKIVAMLKTEFSRLGRQAPYWVETDESGIEERYFASRPMYLAPC